MESDRDSCGVSGTGRERSADMLRRSVTPSLPAAATNATYLRPTTQRAARRRAPPHSKDRFEAEVLGGKLWHRACQEISRDDFNGEIPMEFPSIDEYIATLDPLVLEEAREGLKADWSENCTAGRTWRVEILSVDERTEGWAHVRVKVQSKREQDAVRVFNSNNAAVVLTLGRPPQRSPAEWIRGNGGGGNGGNVGDLQREGTPMSATTTIPASEVGDAVEGRNNGDSTTVAAKVVAGLTIRGGGGGGKYTNNQSSGGGVGQELTIKIHPCCCPSHASNDSAPCTGILHSLRRFTSAWWMTPAGMLVPSEREFDAVHAVRSVDSDLMRHILKPKLLAEIGKYYANDDLRRRMWPEQARHPAFIKYLKSQYDYKQLEAIEMAACHLGGSTSIPFSAKPSSCTISSQQRPSVGQPSTSRLGPSTGKEHKKDQRQQTLAPVPMSSPPPKLSFVLIQGPPGTGKTHTVRGVLNVWHLVAFQRYYESMVQHVLPHVLPLGVQGGAIYSNHATTSAAAPGSNSLPLTQTQQFDMLRKAGNNSNSKNSTSARLGATFAATKPRILICTPSNAACDELMARVMALGFCDGSGTIYRPNIVRAGADDSVVAPAVRERSLRSLVARYRDMSQPEWQRRCADTAAKMALAEQEVAALEASLERCRPGQEASSTARRLVDRVQAAHRLRREVERLEAARDLVWGSGGGGGERGDDTTQAATYRAETELEALLLSEAEMVFATLSSTQRKVFKAVAAKYPFSTVLIDEAGQSSEVAALQPLSFGAKQVVLVGDPQQLPATILSEAAKSVMMERSLFERLQAQGCPVVLLTVQYRMHPEIRSFPSRHFYENKLEDAPSVVELPPEVYHSHTLFKPYAVFDVARGREQRRQGAGGSLSNAAEAELAACLYASLRSEVLKQHNKTCATISNATGFTSSPAKVSVAVITPYREQRAVLRQTFISVCGSADVLKEVAIETVDSYQGRQVDIVILSCVRAGATGGLGFVNDIRRLNVAITRARRSLWVLGSVATLRSNVEWRALLDDAEERGVVVHDAHAEDLFPDLEYWQRKEQITDAGGGDFKKDKGGKKQQQQKQKEKQQSSDIAGPSVVMPDDSRKRPTRGEEEEEAEKELQGGRRKEERASDGDMRPAAGTRPNVGGGVGGGGRGVKGAGRGRVGGGGGPVATAGRGRRSSKKRERSISPQPETIPAPPPAEPSSSKKYPSMPTRR